MCIYSPPKNAIHYLREMPHSGQHEHLVEACRALGFSVSGDDAHSEVSHQEFVAAEIVDDRLVLNRLAIDQLAAMMPTITADHGVAFNRALAALEWNTIAEHEAGHAIVAALQGFGIEHVTLSIDLQEVKLSKNPIDDDDDGWTDGELRSYQKYYAAGLAAERLMQYERSHGAECDKCCHTQLKSRLSQSHKQGFDEDVKTAMALLTSCSIEQVAHALKERGSLSHEDVANLIGCKLPWA